MTDIYAPPRAALISVQVDGPGYATIWQRVWALILDVIVYLIAVGVVGMLVWANQTLAFYFVPLHGLSFVMYRFYMQGKRGQTIGQLLLKIRVVRTDGTAIGFSVSARRTTLHLFDSIPWVVAKIIALNQISASQFSRLGIKEMRALEQSLMPAWFEPVSILILVVVIIDMAACIVTPRRQTLSDLIADSVVVNIKKNQSEQ